MSSKDLADGVEHLLETPGLAGALESDRFKQFLDQIPIAVAVAELRPIEKVVYANLEFERLSGQLNTTVLGGGWESLPGQAADGVLALGEAITQGRDHLGSFTIRQGDDGLVVDAWSNIIEDDDGTPAFRLVALLAVAAPDGTIYVFGGAINGLALSHGRGPCSCLLLHPTLFRRRT